MIPANMRPKFSGSDWAARAGLLLPAIVLLVLAVPHFRDGLAEEPVESEIAFMKIDMPLTARDYADAAGALSHADPADGETQVFRAEALVRSGGMAERALSIASSALRHAPSSARGWIVLADLLRPKDPRKAALALSVAFELAPREYFLVASRATVGASLWKYLPAETQTRLVRDATTIITSPQSHGDLRRLLSVPGGPALVSRALADNPEALRALNRQLARERLGL